MLIPVILYVITVTVYGLLNSDDILLLASLYISLDIPYEAAELIQRETKKGTVIVDEKSVLLLARSWHQARELDKAAISYATLAKLEKGGKAYFHQGQVYMEMQQWKLAAIALQNALDKGIDQRKGRAYLLLGVVRYEMNQLAAAKQALKGAVETVSIKMAAHNSGFTKWKTANRSLLCFVKSTCIPIVVH